MTDGASSDEVFTDVDEELVVGLAAAAGIAIEQACLHGRLQDLALLDDQEPIARDLHDRVIQRIFGVGLLLQGTTQLVRVDPDIAVERIDAAIAELDLTINHLRAAIFGLDMQARREDGDNARRHADLVGLEDSIARLVDPPHQYEVVEARHDDLEDHTRKTHENEGVRGRSFS